MDRVDRVQSTCLDLLNDRCGARAPTDACALLVHETSSLSISAYYF